MNKSLLVLIVATLAAIVMAWNITLNRAPSTEIAKQALYPYLMDAVNTVAHVEVREHDRVVELSLDAQQWKLTSTDSYPAQASSVKALVLGIAELEVLETKTSQPERYSRLGVEDVAQHGATSRQVTLKDAAGNTLANLIVGKNKTGAGPSRSSIAGLYVRKHDTAESLLAAGAVNPSADPSLWWDDSVMDLSSERIREIRIERPGSGPLVLTREEFDADFTLAQIPTNKKLKSPAVLASMANALSALSFDDVRASGSVELPHDTTVTTYSTFDGLVVTVTSGEADGLVQAALSARFDADIVVQPTIQPDVGPGVGADSSSSTENAPKTQRAQHASDSVGMSSEEASDPGQSDSGAGAAEFATQAITEEAAALTKRLQPWTFVLPQYKSSLITKKLEDLVTDIAPEPNTEP